MAWAVFLRNPLVGVGARNYNRLDPAAYGVVVQEKLSHAHNLYLSILSLYGAIGFCALLYLGYLSIRGIARTAVKNIYRPASVAAIVIVIVNGFLNTTLHSEHGMLFAIILAMGLAVRADSPEAID